MNFLATRFEKLSLTSKLVTPFVVILLGTITVLGCISIRTYSRALERQLEKKTEFFVKNLSWALSESLAAGKYDRLQQQLIVANESDSDVDYLVVAGNDGVSMASTDPALRKIVLNRNAFESEALHVEDYVLRPSSGGDYEAAIPILAAGQRMGVLRVGVSWAGVRSAIQNVVSTFILIGLLSLLVGSLVYGGITRRVAQPLGVIGEKLDELARGASDLTLRLPVTGEDEIGRLASAFNLFVDSLGRLISQLRTSSDQVGDSAKSLSEITQQFSTNVSQSAEVMSQIAQNTTQVAQNTQSAATSCQQAGTIAQQGGKIATQVVEKMKEAEASVSAAAGFILGLGRRSEQIGAIVDVITKIADQTNLLSLNAAIEAARAGESGRGFAVVADEIRKLAESSADSAQQIIGLIKEVQEETRRAISVTEKGNREVADGYRLTQEAERLFTAIVREVTQVNLQVTQVAANIQQVAASTEQATASSQEQSAAVHEVANNAQELTQVVQRLTTLLAQFKTA